MVEMSSSTPDVIVPTEAEVNSAVQVRNYVDTDVGQIIRYSCNITLSFGIGALSPVCGSQ